MASRAVPHGPDNALETDADPGHRDNGRLRALDGLRGLCAVLVCLFHFPATGPLAQSALVRGGWLCVDFFFVLSGFVIAAGWGGRLNAPANLPRFLLLRLARIWPLHIVMLQFYLATEVLGAALAGSGIMQRSAFGTGFGMAQWGLSALLLNCFGYTGGPVWNVPAWSIAAEYWSWVIFALAWVWGGQQRLWLVAGLALLAWALMWADGGGMARTWDGGLLRALCGFFVGVLLQALPQRAGPVSGASARAALAKGTAMEAGAAMLALMFIAASPPAPANLASPLVFGLAVHVFAREAGWISRLLMTPLLLRLGLLSSALYISHAFVQARLGDVLALLPRLLPGMPALTVHTQGGEVFGRSAIEGTMLSLFMLVLALAAAHLAGRLVEEPMRRWARGRWASRPWTPARLVMAER